jgi:hypothetical protein
MAILTESVWQSTLLTFSSGSSKKKAFLLLPFYPTLMEISYHGQTPFCRFNPWWLSYPSQIPRPLEMTCQHFLCRKLSHTKQGNIEEPSF